MDLPDEIPASSANNFLKQYQVLSGQDMTQLPDVIESADVPKLLPFLKMLNTSSSTSPTSAASPETHHSTGGLMESQYGESVRPGDLPLQGKITQEFGTTAFSSQHPEIYKGHGHNGIDISAPTGTPLPTNIAGTVLQVGDMGNHAYGRYVVLQGADGVVRLYGHLSSQNVQPGQQVKPGDLLGKIGATGDATGPHLHYSTFTKKTAEQK